MPTIRPINSIKVSVLANLVGLGWSSLLQFICLPLYVRFLGVEAFGLIGFYTMLQATLQVLDFGISPAVNRQLAFYSMLPEMSHKGRNLIRTLEFGYWPIGLLIGVMIYALAPFVAGHWINSSALPPSVIVEAVVLMGVVAAIQWPLSFYQGGLMGLRCQQELNIIRIVIASLSHGGAIVILWQVFPTITAFFKWQVFVSSVNLFLVTRLLWKRLPRAAGTPMFDLVLVHEIRRFSVGMGVIAIAGIFLTQADKIILSKVLSLEMFGYYALAGVLASGIAVLVSPIASALFPRFSALVAVCDDVGLERLYHLSSRFLAVVILPLTSVLAVFSYEAMLLWTGNARTATQTAPIVSLLVVGTALNGLMTMPYTLQLAYGWTKIGLCISVTLAVIVGPAIIAMATYWGPPGAAFVWMALNLVYMVFGVPLTHRRLLKGQATRWFTADVGLPLLSCLPSVCVGRFLIHSENRLSLAFSLGILWVITGFIAVITTTETRRWLINALAFQRDRNYAA